MWVLLHYIFIHSNGKLDEWTILLDVHIIFLFTTALLLGKSATSAIHEGCSIKQE